jgi:hypothetical protein
VLVAFGFTLWAERQIIFGEFTYQTDARLHEYWMRRFQDGALFQDDLTNGLLETGYIPHGFRALYWLLSNAVDPVQAAELMPLVLVPLSTWLLFRIVREHTGWWPAAWLGAILFLLPLDILRFSGGHQRAFFHPIVLLTVYLLLRRRVAAAALVPPLGVLFYPSGALVALVVLAVSCLNRARHRWIDVERAVWTAASTALVAVAALVPAWVAGYSPEIITRSEAEHYPDFGSASKVSYFGHTKLEYISENLSGFNLQWSGGVLVCAALALLAARPANARLLRTEVWGLAFASLFLWALAQAVLFHLYLPQRYTYALIPFCAILIAVVWQPTWQSLARHRPSPWLWAVLGALAGLALAVLALTVFPLGLRLSPGQARDMFEDHIWWFVAALAVGLLLALAVGRRDAWIAGAATGAAVLAGTVAAAGSDYDKGFECTSLPLLRSLETLPKDAIVAGNPLRLDCVPIVSERAVVVNNKLFQVWETHYWRLSRERMFASIDAVFGADMADVLALRERYGADYLLVEKLGRYGGWGDNEPFTSEVRRLRRTVDDPAVERLPEACATFSSKRFSVYDLACVDERVGAR